MKKYILLDNIRSILNVGAIFRTCDGAGYDRLILTGITPTPPRKEIHKTALGAEEHIPWEYYRDPIEVVRKLKWEWVKIFVLEQTDRSIDFRDMIVNPDDSICLIVGNEIDGVSPDLVALADECLEIPMLGQKKSLNVATSLGILAYQFVPKVCSK